jgi:hypothetical protein
MSRVRAKLSVTTGLASVAMLLPTAGCRRPSADLALPGEEGAPTDASQPGPAREQECKTPKPPPGSPDDHESPTIVEARFVARDRVQLIFSEPLAELTGVNPRQFRISHGYSIIDGGGAQGYATGSYYDLAGTDPYLPPLVFVAIEGYADQPEVLALTLSAAVPIEVCEDLADALASLQDMAGGEGERRGETGLFLHYTERGSDGVRDRVQNPLRDIGADWALNFGTRHKMVYGTEPVTRFDLLIPLDCPDQSVRGSGPPGPI